MEPAIDIRVYRIGRLRYRRHLALGQGLPAYWAAHSPYSVLEVSAAADTHFHEIRLRSETWRCSSSSFLQKLAQHSEPSASFR